MPITRMWGVGCSQLSAAPQRPRTRVFLTFHASRCESARRTPSRKKCKNAQMYLGRSFPCSPAVSRGGARRRKRIRRRAQSPVSAQPPDRGAGWVCRIPLRRRHNTSSGPAAAPQRLLPPFYVCVSSAGVSLRRGRRCSLHGAVRRAPLSAPPRPHRSSHAPFCLVLVAHAASARRLRPARRPPA